MRKSILLATALALSLAAATAGAEPLNVGFIYVLTYVR